MSSTYSCSSDLDEFDLLVLELTWSCLPLDAFVT